MRKTIFIIALLLTSATTHAQFFSKLLDAVNESKIGEKTSKKAFANKKAPKEQEDIRKTLRSAITFSNIDAQTFNKDTNPPQMGVFVTIAHTKNTDEKLRFIMFADYAPIPYVDNYNQLMALKENKCFDEVPLSLNGEGGMHAKGLNMKIPMDEKRLSKKSEGSLYLSCYVIHPATNSIIVSHAVERKKNPIIALYNSNIQFKVMDFDVSNITVYEDKTVMSLSVNYWRRKLKPYTFVAVLTPTVIPNVECYEEIPQLLTSKYYGYKTVAGMKRQEIETARFDIPISKSLMTQLKESKFYIKIFAFEETVVRQFLHDVTKNVLDYQYNSDALSFSSIPVRQGNQATREFFENLTTAMHHDLFQDVGGTPCNRCKGTGTVSGSGGGAVDCPACNGYGKYYDASDAFSSANKAIQSNKTRQSPSRLAANRTISQSQSIKTKVFENGDKYTGTFKYGICHGKGTYIWKSGAKYVGEVRFGQMHGKGTLTYADGSKYIGEFYNDYESGKGLIFFADGGKYEGYFAYDMFEGKGIQTFANGDKYIGDFVNGKRHGIGKYIWADGSIYEGEWRNGNQYKSDQQ